jgi:hypothetical protein
MIGRPPSPPVPPMPTQASWPSDHWISGLAIATGVVLLAIGVRFLLVPVDAADFFGIEQPQSPHHLHYVIGVRDLWLGLILIGLGWWREWRALTLTVGLAALVCFADAAIVARATGWAEAIAFHCASGVFCAGLAWACWQRTRQSGPLTEAKQS